MIETVEIVAPESTQIIEVSRTGPQGPPGIDGGNYTHTQTTPAVIWDITHTLGYKPNVVVEDIDGYSVDALISWPTLNTVRCAFAATIRGKAYLS
ncbi:hypothetical protein AB0G15_05975 [Streptosporangium sp. NPDC023825]|uniref:hypothetical protein n=1 Tax=Streptosporangium sp. NPDC023825 TaxID=3154909 RepID=UPI00341DBD14